MPYELPLDSAVVEAYAAALRGLFIQMGLDPESAGLKDTPKRILRAWFEMTEGVRTPPPSMTWFPAGEDKELVALQDIPFNSLCEHHFLPFVGKAHIAYLPTDRIVGLSKLARVVKYFACRPQTQEVMTTDIANFLMNEGHMKGVYVTTIAEHQCMTCRGVKVPGVSAKTSAIRGVIDKAEAMQLFKIK